MELLFLDAKAQFPEIGPSIVLAATALEVFISYVLNSIVVKSKIPLELWNWISDRDFWLKQPSEEEKYSILLKILLGISLKDNNELWEVFKNLKKARNSFVHGGIAKIGKETLDVKKAQKLIEKAREITLYIREHLPSEIQWPKYDYKFEVELLKKIKLI